VLLTRPLFRSKLEQERATEIDFCRLFEQEMDCFYTLALLLTADHELAEKCFVAGLSDCLSSASSVLERWALTWSKRVIIKNAIREVLPTPRGKSRPVSLAQMESPLAQAVLALDDFSRFVFVMSVLEHYSDHECALLLNCTVQELLNARSAAFRQLARATGPRPAATLLEPRSAWAVRLTRMLLSSAEEGP